jgi:hypothetical protein
VLHSPLACRKCSTPHSPLSTLHSPLSTLHSPLSTLHSYSPLSTLHSPLSTLQPPRRTPLTSWRTPPVAALAASDIRTALAIHVEITTTDWTENQSWLIGLKRLIEMITKLGVTL